MTDGPFVSADVPTSLRKGLDRGHLSDTFQERFDDSDAAYTIAADGLATTVATQGNAYAPPLTEETLVCMPDLRQFVLRDRYDRIVARFEPEEVEQLPTGRWYVPLDLAAPRAGVMAVWSVARAYQVGAGVEVVPVRRQCQHFARQLSNLEKSDHMFVERLCTARRDDGGAFLSVMDDAVYACEMREPRDEATAKRIDILDGEKLRVGRARVADEQDETFDVDVELERLQQSAARGGIFGGPK